MRILFLTHYALPHVGGIEVAVDGLSRALRERGHEVRQVASDGHNAEGTPAAGAGEDAGGVVRVPALDLLHARFGVPFPVFSPALAGVLRREVARADVVHGHGFLYLSTVAGLAHARRQARRGGGPARVLTEHVGHVRYDSALVNGAERLAIASLGRAAARSAQAIVALNARVEQEVRALAPGREVLRIPNGVDTGAYRPPEPGERAALRAELGWDARPRALFVGRLVPKKGAGVAAAAATRAGGAFEAVFAGPGRLDLAPADHVTVLGAQSAARVAQLYRAADALVLPSRGEGFPLTAQEALASGLPVVLGDDDAYRDYVAGAGRAITLVRPEAGAVAEALARLFADDAARAQAGADGARYARQTFSWPHTAAAHEALYTRLRGEAGA